MKITNWQLQHWVPILFTGPGPGEILCQAMINMVESSRSLDDFYNAKLLGAYKIILGVIIEYCTVHIIAYCTE